MDDCVRLYRTGHKTHNKAMEIYCSTYKRVWWWSEMRWVGIILMKVFLELLWNLLKVKNIRIKSEGRRMWSARFKNVNLPLFDILIFLNSDSSTPRTNITPKLIGCFLFVSLSLSLFLSDGIFLIPFQSTLIINRPLYQSIPYSTDMKQKQQPNNPDWLLDESFPLLFSYFFAHTRTTLPNRLETQK